jgi:gliding motility-associated-like protein
LTTDEQGNQTEVLPERKAIRFTVSDGQFESPMKHRFINIESSVDLSIPNAFTPNGDTSNDTWQIRPAVNTTQFDKAKVSVYNSKGFLVFESRGFEKSWDGTFNGNALPSGTYYYSIDLNLSYTKKTYKGTVTILR